MDLNINYTFNDKLREKLESSEDVTEYLKRLRDQLEEVKEPKTRIRVLGQIGFYQRILNLLCESEETLNEALVIIEQFKFDYNYWIPIGIKLAHTYQWQRKFIKAETMLNDIIERCEKIELMKQYLHFAYQHIGKIYFDQMKYELALEQFEKAHKIRNEICDFELIKSSELAIKVTQERIKYFNQFQIIEILNPEEKSKICFDILNYLPNWFGISQAILDYKEGVKLQDFLVIKKDDQALGFISLKEHFPKSSCEIYVMGLQEEYQNKGLGSWLLVNAEDLARDRKYQFLSVKTLSAFRPDQYYGLTRKFYFTNGFKPLEEFKTLWDESNPCLLMIKSLNI